MLFYWKVLADERAAAAVKETILAESAGQGEPGLGETRRSQGSGGLWQWIPGLSWYSGYGAKTGTTPPGQSPEGPGPPSPSSEEGALLALPPPQSSDDVNGLKEDTELGQLLIVILVHILILSLLLLSV